MVEDLGCGCWAGEKVGGFVAKAGEGGKDINDIVSFDAVKQEIRGVKLGQRKAKLAFYLKAARYLQSHKQFQKHRHLYLI